MFKTIIEPFKIKSIEKINLNSRQERIKYLEEANFNVFMLKSSNVIIDLLTDSGTSAMSASQWAAMMLGDESYAGASSWDNFVNTVRELTGAEFIFPTHQGRGAEKIIYSVLGGKDKIFISNSHFDTTRANIEYSGAKAIDIPCEESRDLDSTYRFKGNINLAQLEEFINTSGNEYIGGVVMTLTNNTVGGQPVSMDNLKSVRYITSKYDLPLIIDSSRIAENTYFIKSYENGYDDFTYWQIAKEIFSMADVIVMSLKKDGLVNIGGFLCVRDKYLADKCQELLIITEGFTTYGGMAGRDLDAIAVGLKEVFEEDYLRYRVRSVEYLCEELKNNDIPVMYPPGGHAVYIDAAKLYTHIPPNQYPAQALVCELYIEGGIRACEIGSVMFGKYDQNNNLIPAQNELVRLAIPRRVYTQSHIDYVIEVFDAVICNKNQVRGLEITEQSRYLRHFTAKFIRL